MKTNKLPEKRRVFEKNPSPFPWWQFGIALSLIPLGVFSFVVGFTYAMNPRDNWLKQYPELLVRASPHMVLVGIIWVVFIIIRRLLFKPKIL